MSPNGHDAAAIVVTTFPMPVGTHFERHSHTDHQLAWASSGVLTVVTDTATWVLPPTRALWIPAETPHETIASGAATMTALFLPLRRCPGGWTEPTPVRAGRLLAELIRYLAGATVPPPRRARAEALLFDLLEPVAVATVEAPLPSHGPARDVAEALGADPSDNRTLDEWGRHVGASGRTLARAFLRDTGLTFGRWRTMLRLSASLPRLASGEPVGNVAHAVGYETASAFVAAFRRETGLTPGSYFRTIP